MEELPANLTDLAQWISRSNDCTELYLVQPQLSDDSSEPTTFTAFHPRFTYPIFGEREIIFGYKDLSIRLSYASGSLRLNPEITYSAQYKGAGSSKDNQEQAGPDDVHGLLMKYLPQDCISNRDEFLRIVKEDAETFKPIGEKVHEYTREAEDGQEEHFEIYRATFTDEKFRQYHKRMQFFVLLFIEASSYIDDEDEKWEIYTIFKKQKVGSGDRYHFIGYCTAYPFFYWPECTRMRISQFLILPPFQQQGHGGELYRTLYEIFKARSDVTEIAVEDPSEDFSDMRDRNDMRYLNEHHAFDGLVPPVPHEKVKELCREYKLTNRQMQRCVEMYLLSKIDRLQRDTFKAFRLQVKKRLYMFNFDALRELDPAERKEKLHQTFESVVQDYHRLLEMV